jgi:hypothetical protein
MSLNPHTTIFEKYRDDDSPSYCYSSKEIDYYEQMFSRLIQKARHLEGKVFELKNEGSGTE